MKHLVVFLVAFVTVAAMLWVFPATVGADHAVPLKGTVEYTVTSVTPQPDGTILVTAVGTSNLTHLGLVTSESSGVQHVNGTATLEWAYTSANGDQLFASGEGAFTSPTSAAGTFTITGGTGRFMNATGAGNFVAVTTDGFIHTAETFEGTIQY
jgi:hypothetical protein